jgi:glyoxylase-like metal-dependent hydrolase (beta-lactamase superfamily II)
VGRPGGEVAVIDPGPNDPAHLRALESALEGDRVTHIVLTHSHRDHSPLARPLQALTGGTVVGRAAAESAPLSGDEGEDAGFVPDVELADGQVLAGPGWSLETVATPGHTSNHLAFALREEKALFSGDHVMGWSTTVVLPPDGDMGAYLASLDRVIDGRFEVLWPAHGPPVREVEPLLQAYRAHRLEREAQILAQLQAGRTRIAEMVPVLYAAVDRVLWPAAAQSVWAHLIQLVREARAHTDDEPRLDSVYRL